jgi:ligand-binding SRPBCC domain-containing protein
MPEPATLSIQRHPQGGYVLRAECLLPRTMEEVFPFFADAGNLRRLTPPWIDFEVLTDASVARMRKGLLIDYRLRIHGVPLRWQSEITDWQPGRRFVDEQRRGPYRYWIHEHLFEETPAGVRVVDVVRYDVPGGAIMHGLFIGRDLRKIFEFRQQSLEEMFGRERTKSMHREAENAAAATLVTSTA